MFGRYLQCHSLSRGQWNVLILSLNLVFFFGVLKLVSWGNAFDFKIEGIIASQSRKICYSIYEHDNINKWEKDREVVVHSKLNDFLLLVGSCVDSFTKGLFKTFDQDTGRTRSFCTMNICLQIGTFGKGKLPFLSKKRRCLRLVLYYTCKRFFSSFVKFNTIK